MDIVVVTFNRWEYLRRCLASLLDTTPETDRVIVVDNCSFDFTPKYLEMMRIKYPQRRLTVYRPKVNVGCAGGIGDLTFPKRPGAGSRNSLPCSTMTILCATIGGLCVWRL